MLDVRVPPARQPISVLSAQHVRPPVVPAGAVLDGIPTPVLTVDTRLVVGVCNEAAGHLLGVRPAAVTGTRLPVDEQLAGAVAACLRDGATTVVAATRIGSGSVDCTVGPVRQADGSVSGAVLMLVPALSPAGGADGGRDFLAVASHELRTPLTSLQGALDLVASGVFAGQEQRVLSLMRMAQRNAHRMRRLVDDILDLERDRSVGLPVRRRPLEVSRVLSASTTSVAGQAEERAIEFDVTTTTIDVWADESRLVQVLTNLLANAVRHSPRGSVVRLEARRVTGGVEIGVTDDGPGIPADLMPYLFEPFRQAEQDENPTGTTGGGSGLGLAIVRTLVQAHGGTVSVASPPGRGATFTVWLPRRHNDLPVADDRRRSPR